MMVVRGAVSSLNCEGRGWAGFRVSGWLGLWKVGSGRNNEGM